MFDHTPLTNEQKLDEIYRLLRKQESRARNAIVYRILKWILLGGLAFFIATNPTLILGKITELIMPIVTENMKTMMEDKQSTLMESVKNMLPKSNTSDISPEPSPY